MSYNLTSSTRTWITGMSFTLFGLSRRMVLFMSFELMQTYQLACSWVIVRLYLLSKDLAFWLAESCGFAAKVDSYGICRSKYLLPRSWNSFWRPKVFHDCCRTSSNPFLLFSCKSPTDSSSHLVAWFPRHCPYQFVRMWAMGFYSIQ